MPVTLGGWPLRRRLDYAKYLLGITRSEHIFNRGPVRRVTLVIPDSLGDVAINASVTRYFKEHIPGVHISLITHPRYVAAGEFIPDYDAVFGYAGVFADILSGELTHSQQIAIARSLTPDMDRLYLCQPSAWCDAVSAKYSMLEMQNRLCKVPDDARYPPQLSLPSYASEAAARFRAEQRGPAVLIAPGSYTIRFGAGVDEYSRRLVEWCVDQGIHVYWNGSRPILDHERCTAVGSRPLAESVALATLCDAVISMRSGFSDLVSLVDQSRPHLVLYPPGNYPYSRLSWLEWCSLRSMGAVGAVEQVTSLNTPADAQAQLGLSIEWLRRQQAIAEVSQP
ncbi:hypothetical protein ACQP2C_12010 [Micromonospora zamorensis]|uniref:hypothetical protein n=1 Tax=Micromonospora zamorensis TaxID=709883 RepID=UPI003D98E990